MDNNLPQETIQIEALPHFALMTPDTRELAMITLEALKLSPPLLVSSIFGLPWSWLPPYRRYSEYQIANLWQPLRFLRFLINTNVPSLPFAPPTFSPPFVNEFLWQPSVILQRPDHNGSYTSFLDESWFFVNGIMTNSAVAQINAAYLAYLFHRPITLVQNATSSLWLDLLQCAIGKQWRKITEPAVKAMPAIYDALKDKSKERVVVIAHSQGTIVMATVLDLLYQITKRQKHLKEELLSARAAALPYASPVFVYPDEEPLNLGDFEPLTEKELGKLEVYSFATCANAMSWFRPPSKQSPPIPWIEHFGNEQDLVARLGMIAPNLERHPIFIDGPRYMRKGAWGHLLNEHYLYPIEQQQRKGRKHGGQGNPAPFELLPVSGPIAEQIGAMPRLYTYLNGGRHS
ncbi:MAG: hypothetical protein U0175_35645 [Caldilineaceae bacterium]